MIEEDGEANGDGGIEDNDDVDDEDEAEGGRRIGQAGGEARRLGEKGDQSWTRGPTQLQYDDDEEEEEDESRTKLTPVADEGEQETEMDQPIEEDEEEGEQEEEPGAGEEEEEEEEEAEEEEEEIGEEQEQEEGGGGREKSGQMSPLRLRGGAGPSSKNLKPPRPSRSVTAPEPSRDSAETVNPPTGAKRPVPWSGAPAKRQAPRPPGGLRRSSSMSAGGFRPPRPSTATSLAAVGVGIGAIAAGAADSSSADGAVGGGSGHGGSAQSGSDTEGDDKDSNKEERSQVVVTGWGSQGHHPVEYSESQLSFITTTQLRTSPTLARGRGVGTGVEEVGTVEVATGKRQKLRGEGDRTCANSGDVAGSAPLASPVPVGASGGGAVGGTACPTPARSPAACASDPPALDERLLEQELKIRVVSAKGDMPASSSVIEMELAPESAQEIAEQNNAACNDTGEAAVKNRWRGADARLRLAQERGSSPHFSRRAQASGKDEDVKKKWAGGSTGASCSSDAVDREEDADGEVQEASSSRSDQPSVRTLQGLATTSGATSSSLDRAGDSLETPRRHPEQPKETGSPPRAPNTSRQGVTTAPSPTSAVTPGFPASTPTSPPMLDFGHSPTFPLSAHSDQSDLPPLGQPSPALRNVASSGAYSSDGRLGKLDGARDNSSLSSGGLPASRSGLMAGSPVVECLSALTPPISRPRGRPSREVVLRPCEEAPDPQASVAALSRLGVPQVRLPQHQR